MCGSYGDATFQRACRVSWRSRARPGRQVASCPCSLTNAPSHAHVPIRQHARKSPPETKILQPAGAASYPGAAAATPKSPGPKARPSRHGYKLAPSLGGSGSRRASESGLKHPVARCLHRRPPLRPLHLAIAAGSAGSAARPTRRASRQPRTRRRQRPFRGRAARGRARRLRAC